MISQYATWRVCLPDTVDPRGPKGNERRRRPPLAPLAPHQLRVMLHTRWSAEAWPLVKAEFKKAIALRFGARGGLLTQKRG